MIYDNLSNIELYKGLTIDIYEGLVFLKHANKDMANGVYQISSRVKAIVSEYETKVQNEIGFEAHKKFVDIQFLLKGEERIGFLPIEKLTETKPYSELVDAAFYTTCIQPQEMIIGNGYFAVFFPQDGHMPQLCAANQETVKKVVIKIEINS